MHIISSKDLSFVQKEAIFYLWNKEYARNIAYANMQELEAYLSKLADENHYFLVSAADKIEGWAMTFIRDGEKWFAIIVDEAIQGEGWGNILLDTLKQDNMHLSAWVVDHNNSTKMNNMPYYSPVNFYLKNDFVLCPTIRLELENISAVKIEWKKSS